MRRLLILIGLVAVALACDEDPVAPPPDVETPDPVWSELIGFPPATTLYALWAPTANYVVGVGPRGIVQRWNGGEWGPLSNPQVRDLYAVSGTVAGDLFAMGDNGEILRYNGNAFAPAISPTTAHLRGVWSPGSLDFFVVGARGTIVRGNGTVWSLDSSPTDETLLAVWGSGANDVFAVGVNGTIVHFDGASWTPMNSGTGAFLTAVAGTAPDDVYAAGEGGTILHYDGASWQPMTSGTSDVLQGMAAAGTPTAVGANGTILRLDGTAWKSDPSPVQTWLYGVATAGSRTWVVGSRALLADDGDGWAQMTRGAVPQLNGITGPPGTTLRVVGDNGYIARQAGSEWHPETTGIFRPFNAAWSTGDGDVYVVGRNHIMYHDGVIWREEYDDIAEFNGVGGGPSGVYAVGNLAFIFRRTAAGTWESVRPTTPIDHDLHDYASLASDEAYIVGANGSVLTFNGITWVVTNSHVSADLLAVTGDVPGNTWRAIAVGTGGVIAGLVNALPQTWQGLPSPTGATLYTLARGPEGDLYALGQGGTMLSFDGTAWITMPSPTLKTIRNAWFDGKAMFAVGGEAVSGVVVLRYGAP
jgi:hypothetical protein